MAPNAYQLFVETEDSNRLEKEITAYVGEMGCRAVVSPRGSKPSQSLLRRKERQFILSTPKNGFICVWEDGGWADRHLARILSKEMDVRVIWLMVSSATDSWGYYEYRSGKQVAHLVENTGDFVEESERFSRKEKLPFAFEYFPDPNSKERLAGYVRWLTQQGIDPGALAEGSGVEYELAEREPEGSENFRRFTVPCKAGKQRP